MFLSPKFLTSPSESKDWLPTRSGDPSELEDSRDLGLLNSPPSADVRRPILDTESTLEDIESGTRDPSESPEDGERDGPRDPDLRDHGDLREPPRDLGDTRDP